MISVTHLYFKVPWSPTSLHLISLMKKIRGAGRGKGENPSFLPMRAFEGKNGPFGTPVGA